jgi:hypothetical protein
MRGSRRDGRPGTHDPTLGERGRTDLGTGQVDQDTDIGCGLAHAPQRGDRFLDGPVLERTGWQDG